MLHAVALFLSLAGTDAPAGQPPPPPAPVAEPDAPAPPAPLKPDNQIDMAKTGMGSGAVVALGSLAGCGAQIGCDVAAAGVTFVTLGLCPLSLVAPCVTPLVSGYTAAWVGDAFGTTRGAALVPILVGYGGQIVAVAAFVGTFVAIGGLNSSSAVNTTFFAGTELGSLLVPLAVYSGVSLATIIAQPIAYELVAKEKLPGDDGSGFPGFIDPNEPVKAKPLPPQDSAAPPPPPAPVGY